MSSSMLGRVLTIAAAAVALIGADARGQGSAWTAGNTTYYRFGGQSGSAWTPSGGNTTYYRFGGQSGSAWTPSGGNTTYFSGPLFRTRGMNGSSVLFESPRFSSRFSEDAWIGAVENRDVAAMTSVAWDLKALETVVGEKDKQTTSEAMFKAAAQVAVEQMNSEALDEIVALCPACKAYQVEMKAESRSRGTPTFARMPQIVYADFGSYEVAKPNEFKQRLDGLGQKLKPWETPFLTPDLVRFKFRGLSTPDADNVATMINRGRMTMAPAMIAQAAVALAKQKSAAEYNSLNLNPQQLLEEAANLSLDLNDKMTATLILHIYENGEFGLKDPEKAVLLGDEIRAMSGSRGQAGAEAGERFRLLKPGYVIVFDSPVTPEAVSGANKIK